MKKITFFVMALLCHIINGFSQSDCSPDTAMYNVITLDTINRATDWGSRTLHGFDLLAWKDKEVILHDTVHLDFPASFDCFNAVSLTKPISLSVTAGTRISIPLEANQDNKIEIKVTGCDGIVNTTKFTLYSAVNDPTTNDYQQSFSYAAPDDVLTVTTDGITLPCADAYDWAVGTCLEEYNASTSGEAKLYIKYAQGRDYLKKPIIMVEGIDFNTNITTDPETGEVVRYGDNGWENVMQGLSESKPFTLADGTEERVLFRNYPQMIENLTGSGMDDFDVVLIDFKDGADYIQKNGELVIKAIQKVNELKQCGEENVVVALSMGGLVARWALTTMENRGMNHDCRTYISYDSPHLGANIPLSIQGFVWFNAYFGDKSIKEKILPKWLDLNRPAAAQMLLTHFYKEWQDRKISVEVTESIPQLLALPPHIEQRDVTPFSQRSYNYDFHCLRESFVAEMNSLGYPKLTYNLAIANGSGVGGAQDNLAPGGCILNAKNESDLSIWGIAGSWLFGGPLTAVGLDKLLNEKIMWVNLFALPGTTDGTLLSIGLPDKEDKRYIRVTIKNSNPSNYPPYDAMPGCKRADVASAIIPPLREQEILNAKLFEFQCQVDATCFMPTSHVIGYEAPNYFSDLINSDVINENYNLTPFDEIYLPSGPNEAHVDANMGNIDFLEGQKDINLPDQPSELPMPFAGGDTYNFGLYYKKMPSCEINAGGVMRINQEGPTSYRNAAEPLQKNVSQKNHFEVVLAGIGCSPDEAIVNINAGGQMIVGTDEKSINKNGTLHVMNNTELNNIQGDLSIKPYSGIAVWQGGLITLQAGSNTVVEAEGYIKVQKDGTLRLGAGSNLILKGDSKIIVEPGGTLIIEDGANINLEAPSNTPYLDEDGSRIEVYGTLVALGNIDIDGMGYLSLEKGSDVESYGQGITFEGHGTDHVSYFIKDLHVNVPAFRFENAYSNILNTNATINTEFFLTMDSRFLGLFTNYAATPEKKLGNLDIRGSRGGTTLVSINNTRWDDCSLYIQNGGAAQITNSEFYQLNKTVALDLVNHGQSKIEDCTFEVNADLYGAFFNTTHVAPYYYGIRTMNTQPINIFNSTFAHYRSNAQVKPNIVISAAIYSQDDLKIYGEGSIIMDSDYGVQIREVGIVNLVGCSIENCGIGLYVNSDNEVQSVEKPSLAKLICTNISEVVTGIWGYDILLSIDGQINAQSTDGERRPNTFVNNATHFSIIYNKLDPSANLQANYNVWTHPNRYRLQRGFDNFTLDQSVQLPPSQTCQVWLKPNDDPEDCVATTQSFPLGNSVNSDLMSSFCFDDNTCATGNNIQQSYWEAFRWLREGKWDCATERYVDISQEYENIYYEDYGAFCKHQIAVSGVYSTIYNLSTSQPQAESIVLTDFCLDTTYYADSVILSTPIMFVMDVSASVSPMEFATMKSTALALISNMRQQGLAVPYSVVQFSDVNQQVLSIPMTLDTTPLFTMSRVFNGNTHVTNGVIFANNYLIQSGSNARMLVMTDASISQGPDLINITNAIKAQRNITFVRYATGYDEAHNQFYATCSSKGGTYNGPVLSNPGDPQGEGSPRYFQFTSYALSASEVAGQIIEELLCGYITFTGGPNCDGTVTWSSANGGLILSDSTNVNVISTNGLGQYTATITCPSGCIYEATLEHTSNMSSPEVYSRSSSEEAYLSYLGLQRSVMENGMVITPYDRENIQITTSESKRLSITPNPAFHTISIDASLIGSPYTITNSLGRSVLDGTVGGSIDVSSLSSGSYFITVVLPYHNVKDSFIKL